MKMNNLLNIVNENLEKFMEVTYPENLFKSMRYTVLLSGKRLRPIMCLETCRMLGGNIEDAIPTACAIEMYHAMTLIHDDLPCMDNDDLRRGKPSCHIKFGEDTALLAGDTLTDGEISPGYLRLPQAERERIEKTKNNNIKEG